MLTNIHTLRYGRIMYILLNLFNVKVIEPICLKPFKPKICSTSHTIPEAYDYHQHKVWKLYVSNNLDKEPIEELNSYEPIVLVRVENNATLYENQLVATL